MRHDGHRPEKNRCHVLAGALGYYAREPASQCLYPRLDTHGLADSLPRHATMGPAETRPRVQSVVRANSLLGTHFDRGDFVAFVGNLESRSGVREAMYAFRRAEPCVPAVGIAAVARLPWGSTPGVTWSGHRSFWTAGFPAVMVTDTAPLRYPDYHRPEDTVDKDELGTLARVVVGLADMIRHLANGSTESAAAAAPATCGVRPAP